MARSRKPRFRVEGFDGDWKDWDKLPGYTDHKVQRSFVTKKEALSFAKEWGNAHPPSAGGSVFGAKRTSAPSETGRRPFLLVSDMNSGHTIERWESEDGRWVAQFDRPRNPDRTTSRRHSNPTTRVWVDKGYFLQPMVVDGPGGPYYLSLEYQLFDADGAPTTGSYRGQGALSEGTLVLGDPYTQSWLEEYKVARDPTTESWHYYQGFRQAIEDKREAQQDGKPHKVYYANSARWWEGYRDGWREKRQNTKKSKRKKPADNPASDSKIKYRMARAVNPFNRRSAADVRLDNLARRLARGES